MKKWLLRTFYAFLCLGVGAAYADYNATQGTGSVVFAFVCFTTKICPAHVLTNSSGTEIATTSNPVQVGAPASAMTDGWDATQGTKADATYTSGSGSVISILKGIFTAIGNSIPAGTNIIGKVGIDQTTPGTTNGVNVNNTVNAALSLVALTHPSTTGGLANNLNAKASAGNLTAFNCTAITGGAAGYCIAYNGSTTPATGALTGANVLDFCYFDTTARGCSLSHLFPGAVAYSSGIQILVSSAASPYTYTTGTDTAAISADLQ